MASVSPSLPLSPKGITCRAFAGWLIVFFFRLFVKKKIQGRRADDVDRARNQDPGLQRQVGATALALLRSD